MWRFEQAAKFNSNAVTVARYGPGVIGKNLQGDWVDAHGALPPTWAPSAKLLLVPEQHGYYVNNNGRICCADVAPRGYHFSFHDKKTFREVWIIRDRDG